uniref:Uncharacterized protein n=1 Tax=Anguilla anguilla TaxID=7936 RepID=A0A0E9TPZ3_ANGAN
MDCIYICSKMLQYKPLYNSFAQSTHLLMRTHALAHQRQKDTTQNRRLIGC